jgi:hypothetical protein
MNLNSCKKYLEILIVLFTFFYSIAGFVITSADNHYIICGNGLWNYNLGSSIVLAFVFLTAGSLYNRMWWSNDYTFDLIEFVNRRFSYVVVPLVTIFSFVLWGAIAILQSQECYTSTDMLHYAIGSIVMQSFCFLICIFFTWQTFMEGMDEVWYTLKHCRRRGLPYHNSNTTRYPPTTYHSTTFTGSRW